MKRWVEIRGATTDYFVGAELGQYLQEDTIVLLVDTTVSRTIHLPKFSELINISVKIIVVDASGNASGNPISIIPANLDTINGFASIKVDANNGCTQITGAGKNKWISSFGSGDSNSSGGSGSIQTFDYTIQPARMIQLLNNANLNDVLIPALGANKYPEFLSCYFSMDFQGTVYNKVVGTLPQLAIYGVEPHSPQFLTPINYLAFDFTLFPNNATKAAQPNFDLLVAGQIILPNSPIFVGAADTTDTNTGNSPIRMWGSYLIKDVS